MKVKPKCIYIKNIYIQPNKHQKLSNSSNTLFEDKKMNSDLNINNHRLNNNATEKSKVSIKSYFQKICPKNKSYMIKENPNFLSSKNFHKKSTTKRFNQNLMPLEINTGVPISGRRTTQKNYEIVNPIKERSNSENSINCFNRAYTFFNNKEEQTSYLKAKPTDKANKINISENKDQTNISNNKTIFNYKNNTNIPKNVENISIKKKNSDCSCSVSRESNKKYYYQGQTYKPLENLNKVNSRSPNINNTINTNINICAISTPIIYKDNINDNNSKKNQKRIKKYIYSDKKRKSRQYVKEYRDNLCKSTCIKNEGNLGNYNYFNKNIPKRNDIIKEGKKFNLNVYKPNSSSNTINKDQKNEIQNYNYNWIKEKNKLYFNKNLYNNNQKTLDSNYFDSNSTLELYNQDFNKNEINEIKEKILFEQSAIIIQSAFRGYIARDNFDALLYNYKGYNKALEILEYIFNLNFKKDINVEKQYFFNYLKEKNWDNKYNNISYKSYKNFNLNNIPSSPCTESEIRFKKNKFLDIYLHKEIGERFNIIKENKEKELEKKHKEELDKVNSKINELIEENNKLKDINEKNKLKESRYRELSIENKKKENIINIITNDNQNLAKRLKVIIKDKYNKLEIHKQKDININLEDNNILCHSNIKDLINNYRNFYLYYLIQKKNKFFLDIKRKFFYKYKSIINTIIDNDKLNKLLREHHLNFLMINLKNKENKKKYSYFIKLYLYSLLKYKEYQNKNNIIKEKLINIILNKEKTYKLILKIYFQKFYQKGIVNQLYEEKIENIRLINEKKLNNLRKIIIAINYRRSIYYKIKIRNIFDKWNIISKMLSMKAVTDEKKRKKRQKQRTKKKIEKNRSENKYLSNSNSISNYNSISNFHLEKNNINIYNKENKELNFLERSVGTDFSGPEIIMDRNDKIIKASEKLNDIFFKAAIYYKLNSKNKNMNDEKNKNENEENNINYKKEIDNNIENRNNSDDEDSGESSFGI